MTILPGRNTAYSHRHAANNRWRLHQPGPGAMAWITPAARRYFTAPTRHPT
jgi:hypothetical protein